MVDYRHEDRQAWLPLREASKQMGVSAATLRVWADQGRVEAYRTPGGHRRFRVDQTPSQSKLHRRRFDTRWRLLEHSVVGRLRLALEAEHMVARPFAELDEHARAEHRELGRALVHLLVQGLAQEQQDISSRADKLGKSYANLARRHHLKAREASLWLAFFRDALVESVIEFAFGAQEPNADQLMGWLRRVNQIIDRVGLAMVELNGEGQT